MPDYVVSIHEAELEEPIGGRPGEELRQPGEAGRVAELLRGHVALAVAAAGYRAPHRARHKLQRACEARLKTRQPERELLYDGCA